MNPLLVIWSATTILGLIPTIRALWRTFGEWHHFDQAQPDAVGLLELVREDLVRELIILGGQLLSLGVAVLAIFFPVNSLVRQVISWMLVPLPAIFGLLSFHSNHARHRHEERLGRARSDRS